MSATAGEVLASPVIGREKDLHRASRFFETGAPTLLLVVGEDGMGKTEMLGALEREARSRGWPTVRRKGDRVLRVAPSMTPDDFGHEVAELLDAPMERSVASDRAQLLSAASAGVDRVSARIVRRAPIAVFIDGFRPSAGFQEWWRERFMHGIRQGRTATVICVADRPQAAMALRAEADATVELGPLDREEVEAWFTEFDEGLSPPLDEAERNAYVEAAVNAPNVFWPLARTLALAHQSSPPVGDEP